VVTPDRMLIPAPVGDLEADEEPDVVDADDEDDDSDEDTEEQRAADAADGTGSGDEAERRRKRRRRRRRGGRRDDQPGGVAAGDASGEPAESGTPGPAANDDASDALVAAEALAPADGEPEEGAEGGEAAAAAEDDPRNRRRGRRGGRRRRRDGDGELSPFSVPGADQPELPPVYVGPTPADPFGGRAFDIFDVMDQVERAAEAKPVPRAPSASEIVNATAPEAEASFAEEPAPEPVAEAEEEITAEPDIVNGGAPEPIAVSLPPAEIRAEEAVHDAVPPAGEQVNGSRKTADSDEIVNVDAPPPAPLIRPILVGSDGEAPGEKKRGWWRR
jgi:ribonuclease E